MLYDSYYSEDDKLPNQIAKSNIKNNSCLFYWRRNCHVIKKKQKTKHWEKRNSNGNENKRNTNKSGDNKTEQVVLCFCQSKNLFLYLY